MKSYARFEPVKSFGVIASPQCNAIYDFSGNLAISASVQDICVWNIRQAAQVRFLFLVSPFYNNLLAEFISTDFDAFRRSTQLPIFASR